MSGTRNWILDLDDHFPNLDTSHRANAGEEGLYWIAMVGLIWVVASLSNICARYREAGRAARDLEWILCFILKPSWSWTKDMLKRAGKQTVEWLDELWIIKGKSNNEASKDAKADDWADVEDTDDNWSMRVDTPSETEGSCISNATSTSSNTVPTDWKTSRRVGVSDAVDTALNTERRLLISMLVFSHLHLKINRDDTYNNKSSLERPRSIGERSKEARLNHEQPSKPILSLKQRAKHQPAKIIIVEVRKEIAFKEKLIVRMYRTSSFSSLKAALNSDEPGDDTHGLAIKDDEGGYYPVFDNDTPISVGLQHWATLFWVPTPQVPKSLDLTEDIEMDYGHSRRKPSGNARRY
ncbi:hypothetical protein KCU73_g8915, partial [Aureobasidium melanogenum]